MLKKTQQYQLNATLRSIPKLCKSQVYQISQGTPGQHLSAGNELNTRTHSSPLHMLLLLLLCHGFLLCEP